MKLRNFTTEELQKGRVKIDFEEPITEDDRLEMSIFLEHFGKKKNKKKIRIEYDAKPIMIRSITCHKKTWAIFMKQLNMDAKTWYESIKDQPIMTLEELEKLFHMITKEAKREGA